MTDAAAGLREQMSLVRSVLDDLMHEEFGMPIEDTYESPGRNPLLDKLIPQIEVLFLDFVQAEIAKALKGKEAQLELFVELANSATEKIKSLESELDAAVGAAYRDAAEQVPVPGHPNYETTLIVDAQVSIRARTPAHCRAALADYGRRQALQVCRHILAEIDNPERNVRMFVSAKIAVLSAPLQGPATPPVKK